MLSAEAHVQTERPNRYLVQLCRHANQMGQHRGHRPLTHNGDGTHLPPEVLHAEWSDTDGIVRLNWGQWTVQATPGTLTLRAEAADPENLRRIQDLLAARLTKIGRRDNLTVTWQPPRTPTGQPAHGIGTPSAATVSAAQAVARRKRSTTIGLIVAAALAISVHLGLGGAALAGSRWTDLATNLVLAIVALKVIAVVAIALRHRAKRRNKPGAAPSSSGSPHPSLHGRGRSLTSSDTEGSANPESG